MPYYAVTIYEGDPIPEIKKLKTKDAVIEWLMYGINPDNEGVFPTLKLAKVFCSGKIPNYKFKREHLSQLEFAGIGPWT